MATPTYLAAWRAKYPTSNVDERMATLTGSACNLCHHPTSRSNPGNCYRMDIAARLAAGRTIQEALADVEPMDSDGDGVPNGVEILMPRPDGTIGYSPGLVGPTGVDMCGATGAISNQLETPPHPCRADFDGSGALGINDVFAFLNAWYPSDPRADFNGDGAVNVQDVFDFLAAWFAGCA
jgi:hypothetical protein